MTKIRRYLDKEDFYLLFGAIFSFIVILWFQFIASDWEEVIAHGDEISDILVNLALSYIAGWIVYILATLIPKLNAKKKKSTTLKPRLKEVVSDFEFNVINSLLIPNQGVNQSLYEKYRDKPLAISKNDLITMTKHINKSLHSSRMMIVGMSKQPVSFKQQLVCVCLEQKNKHVKALDKFNFLLDEEALNLINNIEYSDFINFATQQYEGFNDYCFAGEDSFYNHYQAVIALNNYIEKKL